MTRNYEAIEAEGRDVLVEGMLTCRVAGAEGRKWPNPRPTRVHTLHQIRTRHGSIAPYLLPISRTYAWIFVYVCNSQESGNKWSESSREIEFILLRSLPDKRPIIAKREFRPTH